VKNTRKNREKIVHRLTPHVESPTWGQVQRMAEVVIDRLGGPAGAAQGLSAESFYVLTILASLNLDEAKSAAFIFGKQYLT
jgi:hypothetical protein